MIIPSVKIDWDRVKESLLKKERIGPGSDSAILKSVDESISAAARLAEPKAVFKEIKALSFETASIRLDGNMGLSGKSLSSYLKGADRICVFLVTIGALIEGEASRLMKDGESLSGYLLDRIGSLAVESAVESLENNVRSLDAFKDKSVSMRLSPGYCDWPIEEQAALDKLLDFSGIGVRLTESCMMIPRKSVSGLMGIGPKGLFTKKRSQCVICKIENCDHRRS